MCVCGSEVIAWQQPAVLIPLYLCLPSPPLNWKQMKAAGDDRPGEGQFNYCDTDRQGGGGGQYGGWRLQLLLKGLLICLLGWVDFLPQYDLFQQM